jgi:putative heme-binding domain-containing protein
MRQPLRPLPFAVLLALLASRPALAADDPERGFRFAAPELFAISRIADGTLAHDIHSLTLDPRGRVVVSGPGYIRLLLDEDGDGVLDRGLDFYPGPPGGCHGMVFHGDALYTTGGRGLERYRDAGGDGVADGPPELLLPLAGGEHGSHALRIGADGFLYLLGGNFSGLPHERVRGFSPVKHYYAGIFCRLDLDAEAIEVWCQGMRNAYDFDFTPLGDAFAWDSDAEREEGLVWYRPCRLYHLTPGADCGWRSIGTGRVPPYAIDSVAPAAEVHRGSPTGVACYRHDAFPARYRGGLFALDWTLGRVLHFALHPKGASFEAEAELFLEAAGDVSFAPTDLEVAPDGSLLIASGGRGIAGAVYRIAPRSPPAPPRRSAARGALGEVLSAPQPLSAWSRARWRPAAAALGAGAFIDALDAAEESPGALSSEEAIRALEVVVELFPAAAPRAIAAGARSRRPELRAQAARWAGHFGGPAELLPFLADPSPAVRRNAAESAMRLWERPGAEELARPVLALGRAPDRRLRQAAIACLLHLPAAKLPAGGDPGERLLRGFALAGQTPRGTLSGEAAAIASELLAGELPLEERLDAFRLLQHTLDRLKAAEDPHYTVFDPEWAKVALEPHREAASGWLELAAGALEAADPRLVEEGMTLAARLRAASPEIAALLAARLTRSRPAAADVFTLWCLAQLRGEWSSETLERVAAAGLELPAKTRRQAVGRDGKWSLYQRGIWEALLERHPRLGRRIVEDERFGDPEHLDLLGGAGAEERGLAARRLLAAPLPPEGAARRKVVEFLIESAPAPERERLAALLRRELDDPVLSRTALEGLARAPVEMDRGRFLEALAGEDPSLLEPALRGLERLPPPAGPLAEALELLRWGARLDPDPTRTAARDLVARRLAAHSGADCGYQRQSAVPQESAFACWGRELAARYPESEKSIEEALAAGKGDEELIERLLAAAPWERGDPQRGKRVFDARACSSCHHLGGAGQRVGPDLGGAARRLGLRELLVEIVLPSRIVAERFYLTEYVLDDGEVVHGKEIYSARNALITVTREGRYRRLDPAKVLRAAALPVSLMPSGLLAGLEPAEVADLVAYLRQAGG